MRISAAHHIKMTIHLIYCINKNISSAIRLYDITLQKAEWLGHSREANNNVSTASY